MDPNPQTTAMDVRFYSQQVKDGIASAAEGKAVYREEERVRIASLVDSRSEFHGRAHDVSYPDFGGEEITYAMRFPEQYAAFKAGKETNREAEIAELEAKLAAAKAAPSVTTQAALDKARAAAEAAKAEKDGQPARMTARQQAAQDAARAAVTPATAAAADAGSATYDEAVADAKKDSK